jgi:hypothetical protein
MNMAYKAAMEEMRRDLAEKIGEIKGDPRMAEVLKYHQTLNTLEGLLNEPQTTLQQLFGLDQSSHAIPKPAIRHDEFAGRTPLEAAKMYLKKWTDARPFTEIVSAITEGGGKVDSDEQLKVSLSRSTLEVVKINDRYGLIDNYPHIKAQRTAKTKKSLKTEPANSESTASPKEAVELIDPFQPADQ